jgi:hypothetical protein
MINQTIFVKPVALPGLMINVMLCTGQQQNEIFINFEHPLKGSITTVFSPLRSVRRSWEASLKVELTSLRLVIN